MPTSSKLQQRFGDVYVINPGAIQVLQRFESSTIGRQGLPVALSGGANATLMVQLPPIATLVQLFVWVNSPAAGLNR